MSLSGTIQGNGITATLQAATAAGGSQQLQNLAIPNFSSDQTIVFQMFPLELVGTATAAQLHLSIDQSTGWYADVTISRPINTTNWVVNGTTFEDFNSNPPAVQAGDGIAFYVEYFGLDPVPQTCEVTITNLTDSNAVIANWTITFNPGLAPPA